MRCSAQKAEIGRGLQLGVLAHTCRSGKMSVQKPVLGGIAKDPKTATLVIFNAVVIACARAQAVLAPPFWGKPLRTFRTDHAMAFPSDDELYRRASWNRNGNGDAHRRLDEMNRANTKGRPFGAFERSFG